MVAGRGRARRDHVDPRHHRRLGRAADVPGGVRRHRGPGRVDDDRLHARPGQRDPADRLGGRPVRHQAALPARACASSRPAPCSAPPATSLEMLVAFRVVQGLGGGMLMPLGMTILTRAAGPERVGRVMAVLGIPMLLGPIFGPILGGALIDSASWHWIFLINLPIGIAALGYAAIVLPKDTVEPSETFDWLGMLLLSPGLAAVPVRRLLDPRGQAGARHRLDRPGRRPGPRRCAADRRLRAVGAQPQEHPPADRPAAVQEPHHDRRGHRDVAVRDRVLRRQPALPALLPVGPRRGRPARRPAAGPPGHRRDDHHADRRRSSPTRSAPARS